MRSIPPRASASLTGSSMASHTAYSDPSDEDATISRRRSSRACDQCRRTKSKCQRYGADSDPCHGCLSSGSACTYAGPSHKRGPPKGYIHAIERRLHQVEALMGTIIGSSDPRAQSLFQDLSRDPLARQVIHRVDHGPFGPKGRLIHPFGSTKEEFLAAIMKSADDTVPSSPLNTSKRLPSAGLKHNELVTMTPNMAWQTRLQELLVSSAPALPAEFSLRRGDRPRMDSSPSSASSISCPMSPSDDAATPESSSQPSPGKRRRHGELAPSRASSSLGARHSMESIGASSTSVALGRDSIVTDGSADHALGLYGKASGLYLLESHSSTSVTHDKADFLSMPKTLAGTGESFQYFLSPDPPAEPRLITAYFQCIHPLFPVLDKDSFLGVFNQWASKKVALPESAVIGSRVSFKLLLLSIYALAVRVADGALPSSLEQGREPWQSYEEDAHRLLYSIMDHECLYTCQALLLLGYHDIGTGMLVRGWNNIGLAMRMGQDLGIHRLLAHTVQLGASDVEGRLRRQLWHGCCIAEKHMSVLLDRPSAIAISDCDAPLFDKVQGEAEDSPAFRLNSIDEMIYGCFQLSSSLTSIIGEILQYVYYTDHSSSMALRNVINDLEGRLAQWRAGLPESLAYTTHANVATPPPCVLQLHMQYWSTVILLQRPLLPALTKTKADGAVLRARGQCIAAADEIISAATSWDSGYGLSKSSPFILSYLLSAGIICVVSSDSSKLQQCQHLLRRMESNWPTACSIAKVLEGHTTGTFSPAATIRLKRSAHDISGLAEDGRRTRPIPDALKQSPQLSHFKSIAHELNQQHGMVDVPYQNLGVSPMDTYTDLLWEPDRMGGMEYSYADGGMTAFPSMEGNDWSHTTETGGALHLDFVSNI